PGFPTLGSGRDRVRRTPKEFTNSVFVEPSRRLNFGNSFGVRTRCLTVTQGRKPWARLGKHLRCNKTGLWSSRFPSEELLLKVVTPGSFGCGCMPRCVLCGSIIS